MDWNRLGKLVKEMRSAQRRARHTRAANDLMLARDLELQVDRMLRLWKPEPVADGRGSLLDVEGGSCGAHGSLPGVGGASRD